MKKSIFIFTLLFLTLNFACESPDSSKPAGLDGWLDGHTDEKFETVAAQLRGFDVAMVETGYRYSELYWAGQDENWDYAKYQLEKIKLAMENGFVRRPKRAAAARQFLAESLPAMQQAVEAMDTALFRQNFRAITTSCNSCHAMEKVPFFQVQPPTVRQSPIQK